MRLSLAGIVLAVTMVTALAGCSSSDSTRNTSSGSGTPTPLIGQVTDTGAASTTASVTGNAIGTGSATPPGTQTQPPRSYVSNCPAVSIVSSTLGITNDLGPDTSPYHQGIQCVYSASTSLAPPIQQVWVYFEPTTADRFAQGKNAVVHSGLATVVTGVGEDAYFIPGDINVLKGSTKIEIVSPLSIPGANGQEALKSLAQTIVASIS